MTEREQLVREAFEEVIVKPLGGRYDERLRAQDFAMFSLGYRAAENRLLSLLPKEGEVVAPVEPTEVQWNGLARAIMMWMDLFPGKKTPRNLFDHLTRSGQQIPQWLKDEPEMQALDHVPSKGTRCCIIYKAMIEALKHE